MKKPDIPANEQQRIEKLHSLGILDTPAEERFDRFTRLAKRMFNVPIALVSLVDSDRQWFKSNFGLEDAKETPRDISFCGHAIHGDKAMVVSDASQDARFADNPLVEGDPNIRFYAGYPLKDIDGHAFGTLCIIDQEPKELSAEDIQALEDLGQLAEREINALQLATLDELTKITNRRGFLSLASKALHCCCISELPCSLVFMDLNGFKKVNDQFGHAEGDLALKAFAQVMRDSFRDSDIFARLGGDEFVVFVGNSSALKTERMVERFQKRLTQYNHHAKRGYDIAFCYGIVPIDHKSKLSLPEILDQADSLMYQSKR